MIKTKFALTNNQLKIIAMITMLIDHTGLLLFPQFTLLRVIGRLSFPIFAYMIAEGCAHTRNRVRYFLQIFSLAAVCQLVYFFAMGSLHQSVLVTFSLSVALIFALDEFWKKKDVVSTLSMVAVAGCVVFLVLVLPGLLPQSNYDIDYKIWGVLLPVVVYFMPTKTTKLSGAAVMLAALTFVYGSIQSFAFFALPLLALYSGTRGRWKLKYLFYIFYPVHLVLLEGIRLLIT